MRPAHAFAAGLTALVAAGAIASCDPVQHDVQLTFYDSGFGPHGFTCHTNGDPPTLLVSRVVSDQSLSLVVDFFEIGGSPTCSAVGLFEWCTKHDCPLLLNHRVCKDIPLDFLEGAGGLTPTQIAQKFLAQIEGLPVTSEPPDAIVLVRVVATTTPCPEKGPADLTEAMFDCDKLVGCANSCPVYLPEAGDVQLDLDVRPEQCNETAIQICASPRISVENDHCL